MAAFARLGSSASLLLHSKQSADSDIETALGSHWNDYSSLSVNEVVHAEDLSAPCLHGEEREGKTFSSQFMVLGLLPTLLPTC